jgi:small subunit ribosomal protein S6
LKYELVVLFDPQLEIDLSKPSAKVEKIIKDNGGKILKTDNWGKKKLAYQINKHDFAVYVFYALELPPESVQKIDTTLNITDEVLRHLIAKHDAKMLAKLEEAKAAKEKADKNPAKNEEDKE